MARIGEAITERKCADLRANLERLGADPEVIKRAVDFLRAQREHDHCPIHGDFLVDRADGGKYPCHSCTTPKRPWPTSKQGHRAAWVRR